MEIPRALLEPENLSAMAGGLLSFLFIAIPGLNVRWDRLSAERKQALMAVLSALAGFLVVIWLCRGIAVCLGGVSWWTVGEASFFAWVANQSVHRGTPKSIFLPKWYVRLKEAQSAAPTPARDIPPRVTPPGRL
jgi:hypothetical protein